MRAAAREFHKKIKNNETLSAVQRDFDFHNSIARAAKNNLLAAFYSNLLSRTFRLGLITLDTSVQTKKERLKDLRSIEGEHDRLIEAIERKNGADAEALARQHAHNFLLRVSRYTTENVADQSGCYDPRMVNGSILT
jgi:DNA-binding GntR family transcriptional regulator